MLLFQLPFYNLVYFMKIMSLLFTQEHLREFIVSKLFNEIPFHSMNLFWSFSLTQFQGTFWCHHFHNNMAWTPNKYQTQCVRCCFTNSFVNHQVTD